VCLGKKKKIVGKIYRWGKKTGAFYALDRRFWRLRTYPHNKMARIKDDSSDDEDEVPISKRTPATAAVPAAATEAAPAPAAVKAEAKPAAAADESSEDEDDVPLSKRKAVVDAIAAKPSLAVKKQKVEPKPANGKAKPSPTAKAKPSPTTKTKPSPAAKAKPSPAAKAKPSPAAKAKPSPAAKAKPKATKPANDSEESDSDLEPIPKKARKKSASTDQEEASTSYGDRWYEEVDGSEWKKGGIKWKTLEHGGVMFPALYVPHGKKLIYDGKRVELNSAQEEVSRGARGLRARARRGGGGGGGACGGGAGAILGLAHGQPAQPARVLALALEACFPPVFPLRYHLYGPVHPRYFKSSLVVVGAAADLRDGLLA